MSHAIPAVSIVLPTLNERGNIVRLVRRLRELVDLPLELLVIDDNSTDGTAAAVGRLAHQIPELRSIIRIDERGLTTAIQRGIDESRGEVIVWMDCDFSMPPETVPKLIALVREKRFDAAIGSRYVARASTASGAREAFPLSLQKLLTQNLNRWITWSMGGTFHDWTSGFIAIRAPLVKAIPLRGDYGEYFIALMADLIAKGATFIEVPFQPVPREHGVSKTAPNLARLSRLGIQYIAAFWSAWWLVRRSSNPGEPLALDEE